MNWKKFGQILQQAVPIALAFTPAAPIAGIVTHAMAVANGMAGASGAEKKAKALELVADGIAATNTAAGRVVIDPMLGAATAATAIETAYGVAKIIHDAHPADAPDA